MNDAGDELAQILLRYTVQDIVNLSKQLARMEIQGTVNLAGRGAKAAFDKLKENIQGHMTGKSAPETKTEKVALENQPQKKEGDKARVATKEPAMEDPDAITSEVTVLDTNDVKPFLDQCDMLMGDEVDTKALTEFFSQYKSYVDYQCKYHNTIEDPKHPVSINVMVEGDDPKTAAITISMTGPKSFMPQLRNYHTQAIDSILRKHQPMMYEIDHSLLPEYFHAQMEENFHEGTLTATPKGGEIRVLADEVPNMQETLDRMATRSIGGDTVEMTVPEDTLERLLREQNSKWRRKTDATRDDERGTDSRFERETHTTRSDVEIGESNPESAAKGDDTTALNGKGRGVPDVEGTKSATQELVVITDHSDKEIPMSLVYTSRENAERLFKDLKALGSNPTKPRVLEFSKVAPDRITPEATMKMAEDVAKTISTAAHDHPELDAPTK
jgi:hypothetical protein